MDTQIIVALIASGVALLTSLVIAISSRKALMVQREGILLPMKKEFINLNIQQLQKIKNELTKINKREVNGLKKGKSKSVIADNIATITAQSTLWKANILPELIENAYLITQRDDLTDINKLINKVQEYKGLLQAKHVYGTNNDENKLTHYAENFDPIKETILAENEFIRIINEEISKLTSKLNSIINK